MTNPSNPAELLQAARFVAVLTIERVADAVPLAKALLAGGVRTLEVTLRTPAGAAAAAAIQAELPEAQVGLGTILTPRDLELAHSLNLPFAFSPGSTPALLDAAIRLGVPFIPGIATPADLMACLERGISTVKLFPAQQLGGTAMLKALSGPFPSIRFNPTGGISEANLADYLAQPNVVAVGGSWLAPQADIAAGQWTTITQRAARVTASIGP